MKKIVTKDIAERMKRLVAEFNRIADSNDSDKTRLGDIDRELHRIKDEYDLSDIMFEEEGKMGLKNVIGTILVPAIYKNFPERYPFKTGYTLRPVPACNFDEKYALVERNGKGTPLCSFEYDLLELMDESLDFYVCGKGDDEKMLYGILDDKGNSVVPCEMDGIDLMEEKCIILYRNGRSGFLTFNGKYIEPQFDEVEITYPCILAEKDGEQSYFDIDGEIIDVRKYLNKIKEFEEFKNFLLSLAKGDSNK